MNIHLLSGDRVLVSVVADYLGNTGMPAVTLWNPSSRDRMLSSVRYGEAVILDADTSDTATDSLEMTLSLLHRGCRVVTLGVFPIALAGERKLLFLQKPFSLAVMLAFIRPADSFCSESEV